MPDRFIIIPMLAWSSVYTRRGQKRDEARPLVVCYWRKAIESTSVVALFSGRVLVTFPWRPINPFHKLRSRPIRHTQRQQKRDSAIPLLECYGRKPIESTCASGSLITEAVLPVTFLPNPINPFHESRSRSFRHTQRAQNNTVPFPCLTVMKERQ